MITLLDRIRATGIKLKGNLSFLNDWKYFTDCKFLSTPGFRRTKGFVSKILMFHSP
jgi:hypothetical protein